MMSALQLSIFSPHSTRENERPRLFVVPAPSKSAPRLHLTRRGRLLFRGVPLLALFALLVWLACAVVLPALTSAAQASDAALETTQTTKVIVHQGESLWQIAERTVPGRDPREVIQDIAQINNLVSPTLVVGEELLVPAH